MNENISLSQNLKESWALFKVHYKVLLLATLILGVVSMVGQTNNWILEAFSFVLGLILQMGFIKISLDILDNKKPEIKTLTEQWKKFLQYFLMAILVMIIILIPITLAGLIFLTGVISTGALFVTAIGMGLAILAVFFFIVPRLMFSGIAIVDNNEKAWQAIKTSYLITKERKLQTIFLFFLIAFLNIAGVMVFFVGLLVTVPLSQLMLAKYYRQISGKLMPTVEEAPTEIVQVENTENTTA